MNSLPFSLYMFNADSTRIPGAAHAATLDAARAFAEKFTRDHPGSMAILFDELGEIKESWRFPFDFAAA